MKVLAICFLLLVSDTLKAFDQIVIWGHKLHSHTHSYIHNAFFRAFQEMGYSVYWLDNADDISNVDFTNTLFITESQTDQGIPLRDDCFYVLHNCGDPKYADLRAKKRTVSLQVYTDDVLKRPGCEKVRPCIYYDLKGRCLYMPWATDLLPREINAVKSSLTKVKRNRNIAWVGTFGGGYFGNENELNPFISAAKTQKIRFKSHHAVSVTNNLDVIRSSYMAPAIVGTWQKEVGYIPCRIFKNISYGQMGITNSPRVCELFENRIVYNPDTYQLFFDAQKKLKTMPLQELYDLMDFVRDNHTYINRIETIFDFIEKAQKAI